MSIQNIPINIVLPAFGGGGAENAMIRLSRYWTEQGRRVTFVVNTSEGPAREQLPESVEVVELSGHVSTRRSFPRFLTWIGERRPRLVVSVMAHPIIMASLAIRLRSPATAHVALVRNHASTQYGHMSGFKALVERIGFRAALRSADMVGAVSDSVARDVIAFAGLADERVWTTLNPIPKPNVSAAAIEGLRPGKEKVLVAVGRLEPQKDYPTLLKAFAIAARDTAMSLLILGTGSERSALETLTADLGIGAKVKFLGYIRSPADYVAQADAFVLTSRFEGFPNVVAEAVALGKTVVATDAPGGAAEILGGGKFGYLAPVGDAAAIAATILKALSEPMDPAVVRSRALDFDTATVVGRYDALFARALERRAAGRR